MATWESVGINLQGRTGDKVRLPCPTCSSQRKKSGTPCLEVNTTEGLWFCHHCSWAGSLRSGPDRQDPLPRKAVVYKKPPPWHPSGLQEKTIQWFRKRGIPEKVLLQFQIAVGTIYMPQVEEEVSAIQFPYFRDGELINIKYRDKDKNFRMCGGAERILYNIDNIRHDCLFICEGEIDCLSIATIGITSVVSVPDGAPKPDAQHLETKFQFLPAAAPFLDPVQKIVLAVDNDPPGIKLAEELARRLGPERCWRVTWPDGCKDANDVLRLQGPSILQQCLETATPWPIRGQVRFQDLGTDLDLLYTQGLGSAGVAPGWPSLEPYYRIKPGDVTVVTGQPQMGKSQWMSALMVNLAMLHGWKFTVFSPENYPIPEYAALLIELYSGKPFYGGANRITPPERWEAEAWLNDHIHFIAADEDQPTIPWILQLATVAVKREGINGLVIDPWNECEHELSRGQTETQYIGETLMQIRRWARKYLVHVWVVAHPSKMQKAQKGDYAGMYPPATLYDISGCYSSDTEVLTADGWKTHDQITLENRVACFDLKTHTISYEYPTHHWCYLYNGPMIHFSSPSFDALVTPNHRMVVSQIWRENHPMKGTKRGRPMKYEDGWGFIEAQHLASSLVMPCATGLPDNVRDIPTIEGYTADHFLKFLGWWISEGCIQQGGVSLCQAIGPIQVNMVEVMSQLGLRFSSNITNYKSHEKPIWTGRIYARDHPVLAQWITNHCGKGAAFKKIPTCIWALSLRQKKIFLEALIDGDGHRPQDRPTTASYATTSLQLANEVQRLAVELGHPACLHATTGALPHHLMRYVIHIGRTDRKRIALRMERHKSIESYQGNVYCLTVPTGAYVTRRHGKIMISGNSANWYNKPDTGITIWRNLETKGPTEVHIVKARKKRSAQLGMIQLQYDLSCGRYSDID